MSHPVRVRGLKPTIVVRLDGYSQSHPVRVRGLKLQPAVIKNEMDQSHPVRVRGLKPGPKGSILSPRVAPRAGAWIETLL